MICLMLKRMTLALLRKTDFLAGGRRSARKAAGSVLARSESRSNEVVAWWMLESRHKARICADSGSGVWEEERTPRSYDLYNQKNWENCGKSVFGCMGEIKGYVLAMWAPRCLLVSNASGEAEWAVGSKSLNFRGEVSLYTGESGKMAGKFNASGVGR